MNRTAIVPILVTNDLELLEGADGLVFSWPMDDPGIYRECHARVEMEQLRAAVMRAVDPGDHPEQQTINRLQGELEAARSARASLYVELMRIAETAEPLMKLRISESLKRCATVWP